jgi:hypothetical protein
MATTSTAATLIRLGRIEGGVEPLRMRGEFPLPLELITE